MSRCLLIDLPNELLAKIVAYLPRSKDQLNLSLCSKRIESVTSELLYREIRLVYFPEPHGSYRNYEVLKALNSRILRQPELAKCVKRLKIRWNWAPRTISEYSFQRLGSCNEVLGPQSQRSRSIFTERKPDSLIWPSEHGWAGASITVLEEMLMFTLIASLPNLYSLDITSPCYISRLQNVSRRLRNMHAGLHPLILKVDSGALENVTEIRLGEANPLTYGIHLDPSEWMPYFHLPKVKKVVLYGLAGVVWDEHMDERAWQHESDPSDQKTATKILRQSKVNHVELRQCHFNWQVVCRILNSCESLHSFIVDEKSPTTIYMPAVIKTLKRHKDSLRNLSFFGLSIDEAGQSLFELHAVEHLNINYRDLIGGTEENFQQRTDELLTQLQHFLPPSLRRLTVTFKDDSSALESLFTDAHPLTDLLIRITKQRGMYWPYLQSIRLHMKGEFKEEEPPSPRLCQDNFVQVFYYVDMAHVINQPADEVWSRPNEEERRCRRWDAPNAMLWDPQMQDLVNTFYMN